MKKNILLLLLALLLAFVAYWLYSAKGTGVQSSTDLPDREFGVKDISTIGKITIQQPKYPAINFVKEGKEWIMNNKKGTNEYVLNDLLALISRVDIDYIPTTKMKENILKNLPESGVNVKIWNTEGELIRDFMVGSEIGTTAGTPFMITGGNQPYIMRVPGFTGSVRSRIINKINEWESKDVYNIDPNEIVSAEVMYDRDAAASFKVSRSEDKIIVTKPGESESTAIPNQKTAEAYLAFYRYIVAEYNDSENPERQRIISGQRFAKITVITKDGKKSEIDYFSYADIDSKIETKSPHQIHPDNKFFGETNDGEMYLVQQRVIYPIFRTYDYFF